MKPNIKCIYYIILCLLSMHCLCVLWSGRKHVEKYVHVSAIIMSRTHLWPIRMLHHRYHTQQYTLLWSVGDDHDCDSHEGLESALCPFDGHVWHVHGCYRGWILCTLWDGI